MSTAQVRTLRVLPINAVDLCFPIAGIIGEFSVLLGKRYEAFDFASFYSGLSATVTTPTPDPSTLVYNSQAIHDDPAIQKANLMALRAESAKALLDKAIGSRFNLYWQKYFNISDVVGQTLSNYTQQMSGLNNLQNALGGQYTSLNGAYLGDGRTGVVRTTSTTGTGPPNCGTPVTGSSTKTDYAYRVPYFENIAQYNRSYISLANQVLATYLALQKIPNLTKTLPVELAGIDLDVKQLQIAYVGTILMSPITGNVTRIRKRLGDYVKAGEPVVRIEDASNVFLVGTVVYAGVVHAGDLFTVTTTLPGSTSPTTIRGFVQAVEGGRSDDNQWHVIVECANGTYPLFVLPLHFSFDRQSTTAEF